MRRSALLSVASGVVRVTRFRTVFLLGVALMVLTSCGVFCPLFRTDCNAPPSWPPKSISGRFDVGNYKLYMSCSEPDNWRSGSPTVVYLHGFSVGGENQRGSGDTLALDNALGGDDRMCSYDRANVGKSDDVPGLRTGESSVKDLHRLLDAAGIKPPYVLVGSSFGGLIAHSYAATFPKEVVGMVLLNDAPFPGEIKLEHYWPKEERLKYQDWGAYEEKLDQYDVYKHALRVAGKEPDIPVSYLQASPPTWEGPPEWEAAMQDELDEYVEGFSHGTIRKVRNLDYIVVPRAPERIAKEVHMEWDIVREDQHQGERVAKEINKLIASISKVEGDP